MSNDKMREEFETKFRNSSRVDGDQAYADSMLERGHDGEYRSFWIAGAWWGWQASRESLVIELPAREKAEQAGVFQSQDVVNSFVRGFNTALGLARNSIESTGAKVKS